MIEQKCREMQQTNEEKEARRQSRGCFYRGSLLPGERLETEESIVIIGDVPQEAVVVSQSDIVVLGELSGSAFAGNEQQYQCHDHGAFFPARAV